MLQLKQLKLYVYERANENVTSFDEVNAHPFIQEELLPTT